MWMQVPYTVTSSVSIGANATITPHHCAQQMQVLNSVVSHQATDRSFEYALGVCVAFFAFVWHNSQRLHVGTRCSLSFSESQIVTIMRGSADGLAAVTFPHHLAASGYCVRSVRATNDKVLSEGVIYERLQ
jgi:hypothetical protein